MDDVSEEERKAVARQVADKIIASLKEEALLEPKEPLVNLKLSLRGTP